MKLVTYRQKNGKEELGLYHDGKIVPIASLRDGLPNGILDFLKAGPKVWNSVSQMQNTLQRGEIKSAVNETDVTILAPVPHPPSCRDAYAFRQHVAAARRNRGVEMIPEFDQFPIFYFTNHNSMIGPGDLVVEADHLQKLDFELEVAVVIGKGGRNIDSKDADAHVFGLTIMNDFSARLLQVEEMKLNLGPAKGKDFATAIGPWLVSLDELAERKITTPFGNKYDLAMTAWHNGKQVSHGNVKDMNWTFAEIIERASYGVDLFPGDVIGSGTVGTGCYLELNGTGAREAKEKGTTFTPTWLQVGDTIELEIAGLGKLTHKIVKAPGERSILAKVKKSSH